MKNAILLILVAVSLTACSSKPKGFELPIAMSEVMRGGALKGLEQADGPILGMPNQHDRVAHTCRSQPIYTLEGHYVRTDVRCW